MTLEINSYSSEETEKLGEVLGNQLRGGEIIELISDLGGGKTTLTRGIARGVGSLDHVSSPTFKICNIYKAKNGLNIYHYDFYRLVDAGLIQYELQEPIEDPKAIIIIEWGSVISDVIPKKKLDINIENSGTNKRKITIKIPKDFSYLKLNL